MNFLQFKERMFDLACFNNQQVYAWDPDFDRNNLWRWVRKGYLIRLRQGYYTFPEYLSQPGYPYFFANRIYRPSYISLHSALSFYGLIPEAVVQITSVTSLKTTSFVNDFGEFSYRTIKETLMFGYELKPMEGGPIIQFATPEKALLDLLYLDSFYNSEKEIEELRLDEDILATDLDRDRMEAYCQKYKSTSLDRRVKLFNKVVSI